MKRSSRRQEQRWALKHKKVLRDCPILAKEDNRPASNSHYLKIEHDYKLKKTFGFIASPTLPILDNMKLVLKNMTQTEYFSKMNTNSYHNLCMASSPPLAIGSLPSLGMKFCIKTPYPKKDSLDIAFARFTRNVRLRYFFVDSEDIEDTQDPFNPNLYIKSDWQPPVASNGIEVRINEFHNLLASTRKNILHNTHSSRTLTPSQIHLLDWLKNNPKFIVLDTDKNLGPAIMEREEYIRAMLDQHLLKTKNYTQLTKEEASALLEEFAYELTEILQFEHRDDLSYQEMIFLSEAPKK